MAVSPTVARSWTATRRPHSRLAKVKPLAPNPDALTSVRGRFQIVAGRGFWIARAWPKKRGPAKDAHSYFLQQQFGMAAKMASNAEPMQIRTAIELTKGTAYMPRDLLLRAAYGKAYEITRPDGTVHRQASHAWVPPAEQTTLAVMLYPTIAQAIAAATATPLEWQAAQFDFGGWSDLAANNDRLTVPANVGLVQLTAALGVTVTWSGTAFFWFTKNGVTTYEGRTVEANVGASTINIVSPLLEVVQGDYFEAIAYLPQAKTGRIDGVSSFGAVGYS